MTNRETTYTVIQQKVLILIHGCLTIFLPVIHLELANLRYLYRGIHATSYSYM